MLLEWIPPASIELLVIANHFWSQLMNKSLFFLCVTTAIAMAGPAASGVYAADPAPAAPAAPAPTAAGSPGFTDITRSSGIEQIVNDKHARSPKWWFIGIGMADLDADGNLDLFMSSHVYLSRFHAEVGLTTKQIDEHDGGPAVAALNDGKAHFTLAKGNYPITELDLASDLDGDGKVDLVTRYRDGGSKWWINRSTPGELNFVSTDYTAGAEQGRSNAFIDLDRDGNGDWMHVFPHLVVERGDGKGNLTRSNIIPVPSGESGGESGGQYTMIPADFDGDGQIDLLVFFAGYTPPSRTLWLLKGDGKMNFDDVSAAAGIPTRGTVRGIGDFNQDGSTDFVLQTANGPAIYLNDGKGHFTKKENAISGLVLAGIDDKYWGSLFTTADFDNDGIPDAVVALRSGLHLLRGTGGGSYTDVTSQWLHGEPTTTGYLNLAFGDLDHDGMLDLVGYTWGSHAQALVLHNDLPKQNYLNVRPVGLAGNRGAGGSRIHGYQAGGLNDPTKLLGYEQVAIWDHDTQKSYYDYGQTERHFGLGRRDAVDLSVEFYPSGKKVELKGVKANTTAVVEEQK
jgi:hypothetical protein